MLVSHTMIWLGSTFVSSNDDDVDDDNGIAEIACVTVNVVSPSKKSLMHSKFFFIV